MAIRLTPTREVEVQGLRFKVKPESYVDFVGSMDRAEKLGFDKKYRDLASMHLGLIERIEEWEGVVLEDGSPAPCCREAKLTLFGMFPDLLIGLSAKLREIEDLERKNSEPSQAG